MLTGFIRDGYTSEATINAVAGLWPAITFSFRPALAVELADHVDRTTRKSEREDRQATAKLLAAKIVSWDVRDDQDHAIDITEGNLLKLRPPLLSRLFGIVASLEAGDTPGAVAADLEADAKN